VCVWHYTFSWEAKRKKHDLGTTSLKHKSPARWFFRIRQLSEQTLNVSACNSGLQVRSRELDTHAFSAFDHASGVPMLSCKEVLCYRNGLGSFSVSPWLKSVPLILASSLSQDHAHYHILFHAVSVTNKRLLWASSNLLQSWFHTAR